MFDSTDVFRRREIRLQICERAIVSFNLSSNNIIYFNNNQLLSFIENRIFEFFDDVQFENSDEINDFVISENVDVAFKHISIFEFVISNVEQSISQFFFTQFTQNQTQHEDNFDSQSQNDVVVSSFVDFSSLIDVVVFFIFVDFKSFAMRVRMLKIEVAFNQFKIVFEIIKANRRRFRRRRNNNDQYEIFFSHVKRRIARFKISDVQKCEN